NSETQLYKFSGVPVHLHQFLIQGFQGNIGNLRRDVLYIQAFSLGHMTNKHPVQEFLKKTKERVEQQDPNKIEQGVKQHQFHQRIFDLKNEIGEVNQLPDKEKYDSARCHIKDHMGKHQPFGVGGATQGNKEKGRCCSYIGPYYLSNRLIDIYKSRI